MSRTSNEILTHDRNRAAVLAHLRSAAKPVQAKHLAAQTGLPVYTVGNYLKALHLVGLAQQAAPREGAKVAASWVAATPPKPPPLPPRPAHCPKGVEAEDLEWMAYWRDRAHQRATQRAAQRATRRVEA